MGRNRRAGGKYKTAGEDGRSEEGWKTRRRVADSGELSAAYAPDFILACGD